MVEVIATINRSGLYRYRYHFAIFFNSVPRISAISAIYCISSESVFVRQGDFVRCYLSGNIARDANEMDSTNTDVMDF